MKRLACSLLFAGLSLTGAAAAQDRYADEYARTYGTRSSSAFQNQQDVAGATYDYARVLRVDPVIRGGYGASNASIRQNCQYRQADDVYARDDYGNQGYGRNDGYYGNDRYASRNDGYYGSSRYPTQNGGYYGGNDGYRDAGGSQAGRTVATVVGGIAGAVLGSKIGEGSGQYVGTAIGSMVGGMAGRSIYESTQRNRQVSRGTVTVCDPVPVGAASRGYGNNGYYSGGENLEGYDVTYEYAGRTFQTRTDYHPGDRIRVRVDVRPD